MQKLAGTLARGEWQWLLAAALLQGVYYLLYAALYQAAFFTVEVASQLRRLVPVLFGAMFFSLVAPGVVAHSALFSREAVRNKQPAGRAAAGTLLVLVARITSFTLVLAVGLVYLSFQHDLKIYEIIASLVLLLLAGFVELQRLQPFGMVSELWGVRLAAIFTGLMGVINLFSAIMPAVRGRLATLEVFSPLSVRDSGESLPAGVLEKTG